jgi:type 2 lantibiotic biosynthesis protein LanM
MGHPSFQSLVWYQATTLTERIASLRQTQRTVSNIEADAELARRRMGRWRSQPPFTTDSYFAQRLALAGVAEDEFFYLLGEPISALRDRFSATPDWLKSLDQAFTDFVSPDIQTTIIPESLRGQEGFAFLTAIEPLVSQGCGRVREGIRELAQAYPELPFDPGAIEDALVVNLPERMLPLLARTMVLELNVARLQGRLSGDTSEARFQSFLELLRQPDVALALLQEYPVLARQLAICVDQWVAYTLEFLQHLCADWATIRETFSPEEDPGMIVQVDGGVGDTHRGGRSVLIARFSSGFRLVYKPRPMAVDVHVQELLAWLNDQGAPQPFRTLKVLDRGSYGWAEFVVAKTCESEDEVRRFYERQGAYLALLYALEATDFHSENLIAAGEHPVLVDLESLFNPHEEGAAITQPGLAANQSMVYSVLRVGLLPQRLWANAESEGIDLSGLGATGGQLTPQNLPVWEAEGTDEMHLARKRIPIPGSQNRPTLNGAEVSVTDYTEAIAEGFASFYRLLLQRRGELLSETGPIARFANDEVRVLLRPTMTYAELLQESLHPDMLRNALDRDRFFDRLWTRIEDRPYIARVIPAEREDLHRGDIPNFTTRSNSCDMWTSSGERIAGFYDRSGLDLVRHRLSQLSEDDLARQLWFVRASLATLTMGIDLVPGYPLTEPKTTAGREQLLAAARSVGDRLESLALRSERDTSWIGLTFSRRRYWSLLPMGIDLYSGLSGAALFLAYLGAVANEDRYTDLARSAVANLRSQLERVRSHITVIGGYEGLGGVIYGLTHLGALWDEPELLAEAEKIVELIPGLVEKDETLDILSGSAGCIGSLTGLHRYAPSDRALAAAIQCGDHLIAKARPMERGVGWITPGDDEQPLAGFSHGAAGIAWSLLELAELTGEERFRATAREAIAYERSLFSPEAQNWRDLRDRGDSPPQTENGQEVFISAWCHGAPGIGLARLRSLPYLDDPELMTEINTALQTTLVQGFGLNHSLCHGDLGNIELLLQASQMLNDPQWQAKADHLAAAILESIDQQGWLCGIPSGVESPGLMTGLAGIGYGLLRLADPARVPSVLTLAPPPGAV